MLLAPEELVDKAPALAGTAEYGTWLAAITARQPANVATADWRRAAAIRTLAHGAPDSVAVSLARACWWPMAPRRSPREQQLHCSIRSPRS